MESVAFPIVEQIKQCHVVGDAQRTDCVPYPYKMDWDEFACLIVELPALSSPVFALLGFTPVAVGEQGLNACPHLTGL
ncbi:hypothetical protein D3C81_2099630 [compost metagenome]